MINMVLYPGQILRGGKGDGPAFHEIPDISGYDVVGLYALRGDALQCVIKIRPLSQSPVAVFDFILQAEKILVLAVIKKPAFHVG